MWKINFENNTAKELATTVPARRGPVDFNTMVIADGTLVPAVIKAMVWKEGYGEGAKKIIQVQWQIEGEGPARGKTLFHKLNVLDDNEAKATRDQMFLQVIDYIHSIGILQHVVDEGRLPFDEELSIYAHEEVRAVIQLSTYTFRDDKLPEGNYVSAVLLPTEVAPHQDYEVTRRPAKEGDPIGSSMLDRVNALKSDPSKRLSIGKKMW